MIVLSAEHCYFNINDDSYLSLSDLLCGLSLSDFFATFWISFVFFHFVYDPCLISLNACFFCSVLI